MRVGIGTISDDNGKIKQIKVTIQESIVAGKGSMLTTVRLLSCHMVMHWAGVIIGGEVSNY